MSPMYDASSDLPDSTLIEAIRFPQMLRNALIDAGLKTVGEVRSATNEELHAIPDIGPNSIAYLRLTLGH